MATLFDSVLATSFNVSNGTQEVKICEPSLYLEDAEDSNRTASLAMFSMRIISSSLSILATASVILLTLISRNITNSEVHPIFMLTVADFLVASLWLVGSAVYLIEPTYVGACYSIGILTTIFEISSYFLTGSYAVIVYLSLLEVSKNDGRELPLRDRRKIPRYICTAVVYLISWLLPLVIIAALMLSLVYPPIQQDCCAYCVADLSSLRAAYRNCTETDGGAVSFNFDLILSVSFFTTFTVTLAAMLIFYVLTMNLVIQLYKKYQPEFNEPRTNMNRKKTRRMFIRISLFGLIYILCGLPTIVAAIVVWTEGTAIEDSEHPDITILIWQAIFTPLQGFLNSLVYGWTRRSFRHQIINCSSKICCLNCPEKIPLILAESGDSPKLGRRNYYHSILNSTEDKSDPTSSMEGEHRESSP